MGYLRVLSIETAVHIARKLIMITSRKFILLRFFCSLNLVFKHIGIMFYNSTGT